MLLLKKRLFSDPKLLGRWGEKRCEKFLKQKGLHSLTRNFSCKTGEIDLIMVDSIGTIVFVEVKCRINEDFTPAENLITTDKQRKMFNTARYFLSTNNIESRPYRFDIVTIVLQSNGHQRINHYENAFVL
jgi:putative endonuclease